MRPSVLRPSVCPVPNTLPISGGASAVKETGFLVVALKTQAANAGRIL